MIESNLGIVIGILSEARFLTVSGNSEESVLLVPEKIVPDGSALW